MSPYINKILLLLFASLTVCLMLVPPGLAAPAPVISGLPLDTNETLSDGFCWNATTFGGFVYPVNKHKDFAASEDWWGERLQYVEKDGQNELGKSHPGNHGLICVTFSFNLSTLELPFFFSCYFLFYFLYIYILVVSWL